MTKWTFDHIETIGHLIDENDLYKHYHYPEMLIRYDSNFMEFKRMPSLQELKEVEHNQKVYHQQHHQNHIKFEFPDNQKPTFELINYLEKNGYEVGFLELYSIQPKAFPAVEPNPDIKVLEVMDNHFEDFVELQYSQDIKNGKAFAEEKVKLNERQRRDDKYIKVIAYYEGKPAGTMNVILSDQAVEIDDLEVRDEWQRKGIGSRLQRFVMDKFPDSTIILVADGEDTPKEMYQKQNYQYQGFKYEALKIKKS
ncbi:Acetyltransferase (GNAT) domain-containing protein [Salinibacillus kushneri]|uniref:Acetyltransferase (GNAT) domain-containing protein n=1 Tax=Salinibacillus kushneri TaxID=237682 RepID=A0A1I0GRE2_9BACI|nr:GNAT family N-acetyltransferase [Salinibacillus kushneri]SET72753.1 Acetyltransferase (GNAT) domain-containing protein [Salinibacillus kushneri]